MKIASWNVNSLNVRLPHVLAWLQQQQPDVLAIQETKLTDDKFPESEIQTAGYHAVFSGQKTYNGVAIISKKPAAQIMTDIPGYTDPQRRILGATVDGIRILNLYVVNGSAVGTEKYHYKLEWLRAIRQHIRSELTKSASLVVLGDFNIAPEDRDTHDPAVWNEKILCSTPERESLRQIQALGLVDAFRLFAQAEKSFTWWDYREAAFRRNMGMRIDLILASDNLAKKCRACHIDREPRTWERPSDHAPLWAEFEI